MSTIYFSNIFSNQTIKYIINNIHANFNRIHVLLVKTQLFQLKIAGVKAYQMKS